MYDPEIDEPFGPEYAITISGNRLRAGWLITAPTCLAFSGSGSQIKDAVFRAGFVKSIKNGDKLVVV